MKVELKAERGINSGHNLKRILAPPFIAGIFSAVAHCGRIASFSNSICDHVFFCSMAFVVLGSIVLQFVVLWLALAWWLTPITKRSMAASHLIGWSAAWLVLAIEARAIISNAAQSWP